MCAKTQHTKIRALEEEHRAALSTIEANYQKKFTDLQASQKASLVEALTSANKAKNGDGDEEGPLQCPTS